MAIEIVSFPTNSMVIFHGYVKLPEGMVLNVGHDLMMFFQNPANYN